MNQFEADHKKTLRQNAHECAVLLRADGNFPLQMPCAVALYGNGVRHTIKGGTGSGDVYCRKFSTCEQALENAGFHITTKAWLDAFDAARAAAQEDFSQKLSREAAELGIPFFLYSMGKTMPELDYHGKLDAVGDVAIYVLSRNSGEGADRNIRQGDILLSNSEIDCIRYLNEHFGRFMLVLNVGGPVDLSPVREVKNILLLSQLGCVTAEVLADILLGKANPSGKLSTTWTAPGRYCPKIDFGNVNDTRYLEGVYVGYRYFDSAGITPDYPFGFGLSYTHFRIRPTDLAHSGSTVSLQLMVTNTGGFAGKEVVQLYLSPPKGKIDKPFQSLVAFEKTENLQCGQTQRLTLHFDLKDAASFDEQKAAYILEPGTYILRLGNSSRSTQPVGKIILDEEIITSRVGRRFEKPDFTDAVYDYSWAEPVCDRFVRLTALDFTEEKCNYIQRERIPEAVKQMTTEQLALLCVGFFQENGTFLDSIIGKSALHVCGAAGETTDQLEKQLRGKYLVMADGPAGLRIANQYFQSSDGKVSVHSKKNTGDIAPLPQNTSYNGIEQNQVVEQYTTAIPIGTAVAQSWNHNFAVLCGQIVGKEMQHYGIHLWLAPALNIHRSILCGRNFEYYSEDPVLSGMTASAVIAGVHKNNNCSAVAKHFACNNQETNRYGNNSMVSERALREIYLRAFEICIKQEQPKAVMTSYNLINGVHTSESSFLMDILREEFGFRGIVMSDWIQTGLSLTKDAKYPAVHTSNMIRAGNDLMMPGSIVDYDDVISAVEEGRLSRRDLERSASRIYHLIFELNTA